jgi:hypothetical protein
MGGYQLSRLPNHRLWRAGLWRSLGRGAWLGKFSYHGQDLQRGENLCGQLERDRKFIIHSLCDAAVQFKFMQ